MAVASPPRSSSRALAPHRRPPSRSATTARVHGGPKHCATASRGELEARFRDFSRGAEGRSARREASVERSGGDCRRDISVGVERTRARSQSSTRSTSPGFLEVWEMARSGRRGLASTMRGRVADPVSGLGCRIISGDDSTERNDDQFEGGWATIPTDILYAMFHRLMIPKDYWTVARVCSSWRFAIFSVPRPMALTHLAKAMPLDPLPFPPVHLKLLMAKPSKLRNGLMLDGRLFGFHTASAIASVGANSRLIGSFSGLPFFIDTLSGCLELPTVCTALREMLSRFPLPVGVSPEEIYLGSVSDDYILLLTPSSVLLAMGTSQAWFSVPLDRFELTEVRNLVFAKGVAYLMDGNRRMFSVKLLYSSSVRMTELRFEMNHMLPPRQLWEKTWLVQWPTGGTVVCICYQEIRNGYQFTAYDLVLLDEEGNWGWRQRDSLDDCAVFVNWGFSTLGFAHRNPERWALARNFIYQSPKGAACELNRRYDHRIMPRLPLVWPFAIWMLAAPSDLDLSAKLEEMSE